MKLKTTFRQGIELFFFYYANGTLNMTFLSKDYQDKTTQNPELFWKCAAVYINHAVSKRNPLKWNRHIDWLQSQFQEVNQKELNFEEWELDFSRQGTSLASVFKDFCFKLSIDLFAPKNLDYSLFTRLINDPSYMQLLPFG